MKRFIFIIVALIGFIAMSAPAKAQWNKPEYFPADELTGSDEYYANLYKGDCGYFVSWTGKASGGKIKVATDSGIFDYETIGGYYFTDAIVGFYEGDKLVDKVVASFNVPKGDADTAYCAADLALKIKIHLKTKGKVRIIISKYGGPNFDLTIPMNKNLRIKVNENTDNKMAQSGLIASAEDIIAAIK